MNSLNSAIADHPSAVLDAWLSDALGKKSYRLSAMDLSSSPLRDHLHEVLLRLPQEPLFIYAKVPTDAHHTTRFLEDEKFRLIDTNIVFDKKRTVGQSLGSVCTIRFARSEDKDHVEALARRSFSCSRFHRDSAIDRIVADNIKARWAAGYFLGERGDQMVIAESGNQLVGFLQLIMDEGDTLIIDLIAVDERFRGQGIAADMIHYAENQIERCGHVRVGTQVANASSIHCYEKAGFRHFSSSYVFHFHSFLG